MNSPSLINLNNAILKAIEEKENLYLPILSNFKPLGFIFQVLAFHSSGAAYQKVCIFLTELSSKAQSRAPLPFAFNASNFLSYATQRLSILVNIGTAEMIKHASVLSDPVLKKTRVSENKNNKNEKKKQKQKAKNKKNYTTLFLISMFVFALHYVFYANVLSPFFFFFSFIFFFFLKKKR